VIVSIACGQLASEGFLSLDIAISAMISGREAERVARLRSMMEDHFETVWRALRRLGVAESGADDGAQHVFLVALRRLDEIAIGGERSYLLGIALRVASEARRALSRRREVPIIDVDALAASSASTAPRRPDEVLEQKRALALLAALLDEMQDDLREAFVLFELEELSAPEVARVLDVPVGTVASRVRRAREHLRMSLAKGGTQ
jgi:RNA polymerase sigma-70 factor (ECF subfamily)